MDAGMADRLAASIDPKTLSTLQNRGSDPAVARAVAAQFGSFLMQGMMQGADGTAMTVADGTGGATVSAMFASAMGRYAMSGDKLGLADAIYRSMAAKGGPDAPLSATTPASSAPVETKSTKQTAAVGGISLEPYRLDRGHRPLGAPLGNMTQPANIKGLSKTLGGAAGATKHDLVAAATVTAPAKTVAPPIQTSGTATTAPAVQAVPPDHSEMRVRWAGMSLPPRANVLLPPAESAPPTTADNVTTVPTAPTAAAKAASIGDAQETIPYGLPWTHQKGGVETGAPGQHHASTTGPGGTALAEAENFAEELAPALQQAAAKLGVSPRVLLAQAALETGWGHSVVGNNIFGIKAGGSWSGTTVTAPTHEMEGGRMVAHQGAFRSYASVSQAVDDYVSLVSASNRYRSAIGSGDNVAAYGQALAAGGYASDRDYAAKLAAVANSSRMSYAVASLDDDSPGQLISAHG